MFHLKSVCQCDGDPDPYELMNGHIQYFGFASSPAIPLTGTAQRPAVDEVFVPRLCRYPPIAPLELSRPSNIPQSVLQSLKDLVESSSSPCFVIHAAFPGQCGQQLRVSTTLLERCMLRSMTTLQGQLFVILKYFLKKVLSQRTRGLKPYHMKTILFRLMDELPPENWKAENLVDLTRHAMQMLLECVENSRSPDNINGALMKHFFLEDVDVFLKGAVDRDRSIDRTFSGISNALIAVIDELPQLLLQFISSLRPASNSAAKPRRFSFHPFLILPDLRPAVPLTILNSQEYPVQYHEIYDVVRECLMHFSNSDNSTNCQASLTSLIARLPDCALSAREALRVLTCLKFDDREGAQSILSQCRGHLVCRGIDWSADRSAAEATVQNVWEHLTSQKSAWKFCFEFDKQPEFRFLPGALKYCFPIQLLASSAKHSYMNFDALLWALRFELQTAENLPGAQDWIRFIVAESENDDEQELLVAILYSPESRQVLLERLINMKGEIPDWLMDVCCRGVV
ncbi:hypothetical protein BOX15_Mlig001763g2 [Macrostomum lignano]|uniref:Mab-21-like HhH/H2TH-like domain-containing protein n=1 Tax=Macrostomum lignano TaxID=282301 RepID=A0A267GWJ9_9PLAT|nr:hypothetical protein BOX15_Mlig001763g2 [Macrostomum lignano]